VEQGRIISARLGSLWCDEPQTDPHHCHRRDCGHSIKRKYCSHARHTTFPRFGCCQARAKQM